jgi:hypothetical protein
MSIGPDIKEALQDVGTSFTILLPIPISTPEKLVSKGNSQVSKPFLREFFLEATLAYDTKVTPGTVVQTTTPAIPYIIMNKTPNIFEDEIIEYKAVLYKANVSGEISRISGESSWNSQYQKVPVFQVVRSNAYALQTEILAGSGIHPELEIGAVSTDRQDLYVPSYYGIKELDRYQPVSGEEIYLVKSVKTRIFENVDVAELITDTR